ncbi:MAG: tetratricopeptide repeat protein, partial [Flavobacteriaceae bacterium]|nr:tetratricopeptide repeat protein [Flavobacteriaceae bacterium]
MMNSGNNEGFDFPIKRFEEMMNSNQVLYFDAAEFENIIQFYMDFGRMGLAKKAIKMGLQQHPDSFKLQLMKADLLNFEDKTAEAFQLLFKLTQIEPYNEDLYVMMANLYSKQDEHEKAIECLQKILKLNGDSTLEDVHYLLGMEHLMLENYQQAKEHFIKTLEADGEDEVSLQNIIFCYEFLDKMNDAKAFLKVYLDKSPYSAIAWHQLGNIYQD